MHLEAVVHAHAAAFLGRSAWDVAHDDGWLADAHRTAWECYRHRLVIAGIDLLSTEAEAFGAAIEARDESPRFVAAQPLLTDLAQIRELPELDPAQNARLATALSGAQRIAASVPALVAVPIAGPLATARLLLGSERIQVALGDRPDGLREALTTLVRKLRPWMRAIAASRLRIAIAEEEYVPAQLRPDDFAAYFKPALAAIVHEARLATGHPPVLLLDGDTAAISNHLCSTGAGMIVCPAQTNQALFLEHARGFRDTLVRVDLDRRLWVDGDAKTISSAVAEATVVARKHPRALLGTGPLPLQASSVQVVDACNFATSMDPWLDPV